MKIVITFKNIDHTPALDEKIRQKSEKLEKYLEGNTELHWTCSAHDECHTVELNLNGPSFHYHATAESDNLYKTFDFAIEKMEKQLNKKKEKWKNKIHHKHDPIDINDLKVNGNKKKSNSKNDSNHDEKDDDENFYDKAIGR